ncbi:hypothetical protein KR074_000692 [Drosophila pseudoananassae]|nr:hypothetical protein KR074_000692 [Drosophila pseudoananassae]
MDHPETFSCGDYFGLVLPTQVNYIKEEDIDQDMLRELFDRINRLPFTESQLVIEDVLQEVRDNEAPKDVLIPKKTRKLVAEFQEHTEKLLSDMTCIKLMNERLDKMEATRKKRAAHLADMQVRIRKYRADIQYIALMSAMVEELVDKMEAAGKESDALVADVKERIMKLDAEVQYLIDRAKAVLEHKESKD